MITPRTDLAVEAARRLSLSRDLEGVTRDIDIVEAAQLEIADITIKTSAAAREIGRPKGRYITLKALDGSFAGYCPCCDERVKLLAEKLRALAGNARRVLVAGLGNRHLTADSLGPLTVDKVFATRHLMGLSHELDVSGLTEVSAVETGVLGQTGIESTEQIKALCAALRPDLVIAVDALACWDLDHLGRTIQLCDTGISPGSGVENSRKELSRATLGTACIAIGVPMVVDLASAAEMIFNAPAPENSARLTVTPDSIDRLAASAASYIADGINLAFQRSLSASEIRSLI
ncbi:GPR endopeptidase [Ruminococcus sp.]|uniref:GPR endopeptidase n=1 Tax=Ruminococcus sp. TaxID=41978 RepID=UPI0025FE1A11|nr:GPR endopeptidase [Ruminococcus sp.]MBQ8965709.1 GPR endopeptidase [Ruminococcus sp.]